MTPEPGDTRGGRPAGIDWRMVRTLAQADRRTPSRGPVRAPDRVFRPECAGTVHGATPATVEMGAG